MSVKKFNKETDGEDRTKFFSVHYIPVNTVRIFLARPYTATSNNQLPSKVNISLHGLVASAIHGRLELLELALGDNTEPPRALGLFFRVEALVLKRHPNMSKVKLRPSPIVH